MKREGNKIRAWLVERRITVSELARRAKIARSMVSETGPSGFSVGNPIQACLG